MMVIFFILAIFGFNTCLAAWQENVRPKMYVQLGALLQENEDRNALRITRRNLRDNHNAFEIPEAAFKQMFRLDKQSVLNLINEINPHYIVRGSIPLHLKVLATLNFLATGSFQNPVGCNIWLSLSQTMISRIIFEITALVTNFLFPIWIKFPINVAEKNNIKQGFYEKWDIRGVIGVIDGTHVEIIAPPINDVHHPPFVYINRKGRHSINVMLISDSNSKIIGCNARYPGSVHDSAIWQMSNIRNYLRNKYTQGDRYSHLLGDSGYPLEPWLFTPFNNPQEGSVEQRFNVQFTRARNVIERTNGILKGRFRCLSKHRVLLYNPVKAAQIIYTCCVLHNMALRANLHLPEEEIEYRENPIDYVFDVRDVNDVLQEGRAVRNEYVRHNFED